MKREATLSECGRYRFDLTREVEVNCNCKRCATWRADTQARNAVLPAGSYALWVLCNPSTADASVDDPTERRGWAFTSSWGYGKMVFVNTSPVRSTNPRRREAPSLEARNSNKTALIKHARSASIIICAWGSQALRDEANETFATLDYYAPHKIYALEFTLDNDPRHPLYLPKGLRPLRWNGCR